MDKHFYECNVTIFFDYVDELTEKINPLKNYEKLKALKSKYAKDLEGWHCEKLWSRSNKNSEPIFSSFVFSIDNLVLSTSEKEAAQIASDTITKYFIDNVPKEEKAFIEVLDSRGSLVASLNK